MSVFVTASGLFKIDLTVKARRVQRNTQTRNRKEALSLEKALRKQVLADLEQERLTGHAPLTLDDAFARYWREVGQQHANAGDTHRDIARIIGFLGPQVRLDRITDADLARLVAWRASHTVAGRKFLKDGSPAPLITPATVNRTAILPLKSLFGRAKRVWRMALPNEPVWREHLFKEPEERVRELRAGEGEALEEAVRPDYAPWLEFARLTGLRRNETLIRWEQVNFETGQIILSGKGGKWVTTPITPTVRALLEPLRGHHPQQVFTYVAEKTCEGRVRGERYPITPEGAKTQWRRLRARAGLTDFRFHDVRHDLASKLLRATGNLKLVQRTLNHSDLKTTLRYAHVQDSEVLEALENLAAQGRKPLQNLLPPPQPQG